VPFFKKILLYRGSVKVSSMD